MDRHCPAEVAEHLVVRAVLLDDVDHVGDLAGRKADVFQRICLRFFQHIQAIVEQHLGVASSSSFSGIETEMTFPSSTVKPV